MALLLELLDTTRKNTFNNFGKDKKQSVVDGFYKVLYYIIEDHKLPYTKAYNRAFGEAIAHALKIPPVKVPDTATEDLTKTRDFLQPLARNAVDEAEKIPDPMPEP